MSTRDLDKLLGSFANDAVLEPARMEIRCGVPYDINPPAWKRILDLTCIFLTLPLWGLLMLVIAAFVKIVSPGPLFFRQERIGYRAKSFKMLKFRSMVVNAETQSHESYLAHLMRDAKPMKKLDVSDKRLISCGRILRATGLDELPQIFNILRGDMSLVGPRPCTPMEYQHYQTWQKERVNAVPGVTGYWQVNGKNNTTFEQMIRMDIYYLRHLRLSHDLLILLKTIPVLTAQTIEVIASSLHSKGRPGDAPQATARPNFQATEKSQIGSLYEKKH